MSSTASDLPSDTPAALVAESMLVVGKPSCATTEALKNHGLPGLHAGCAGKIIRIRRGRVVDEGAAGCAVELAAG